jgi:signal transduction histidine kinase
VWTNLLDNAIDAVAVNPEGSRHICVGTARENGSLLVEIADNGTGIPPDVQAHIFEPFFTTKAIGKGTGLGLGISHRIVVGRHGGDMSVTSRPGDTHFQVRLPFESPA